MARAYVSLGTFREGSNIRSWLHRILVNKWLDNHRRAQRRPVERMSAEGVEVQVAVDSRWIDQCQQSAETEALSRMAGEAHSALLRLPVELRGVVYFACIEGYRNTEIAGILGCRWEQWRLASTVPSAGSARTYQRRIVDSPALPTSHSSVPWTLRPRK